MAYIYVYIYICLYIYGSGKDYYMGLIWLDHFFEEITWGWIKTCDTHHIWGR